jgi:pimeloyl-ACP methyl ester carboxylesterase
LEKTVTESATLTEPVTRTLDVPGATITYDVRANATSEKTPLMLIGYPMAAAGFVTLASHFPDRTVITYDPRGSERSTKKPDAPVNDPDLSADDVHAVIQAVGGPVDLFASSGGAVTALALTAKHPEDVRTVVAHEPPLTSVLADRADAEAAVRDIHATYQRDGFGPAMAKFIAIVSMPGPIPADFASQAAPDPAMFGMPTEDDGKRDDVMFTAIINTTGYEPDYEALRAAPVRLMIAEGEESNGVMAARGAEGVAERLGTEVVQFPSDHGGFLGGEYGQTGKPTEFAAKLREVLDSNS